MSMTPSTMSTNPPNHPADPQAWRTMRHDEHARYPPDHRYASSSSSGMLDQAQAYGQNGYPDHTAASVSELKPATDGSWRRDSPMEYRQEPHTWRERSNLRPRDSATSLQSSTGSFALDERKAHDWEVAHNFPLMPSRGSSAQKEQPMPSSWATSGNAPAPRRIMNFSRPLRKGEESSTIDTKTAVKLLDGVNDEARNTADDDLERRLNNIKSDIRPRARKTDRSGTAPQPQQSLRPPMLSQSGKVYSRPTLSPIPSMASAVTLSQLRPQQEELDEDHELDGEQEDELQSTTPRPWEDTDFVRNAIQPSASASSSTTSFASQLASVPPSHYPATSPLADGKDVKDMPNADVFTNYSPYPTTRAPPPSIHSHRGELSTSSTSTGKSNFTSGGRSGFSNPTSAHTSATTSSQPSMDIDRIAPVPTSPLNSPAAYQNRFSLTHTGSISSNPSSLSRAQPVRTNSTTSSGATSAMEAFKASNYDISTLTASQIAKLKKKGIDPALYMEMKAATSSVGKDGKKRSKWSRALVGNTFIG